MRRGHAGSSLASVLIVISIALTAAFSLAAGSFFHFRVSEREDNGIKARNLADSVIARAMERVMVDETFGATGGTVEVKPPLVPEGQAGVLTFSQSVASQLALPWSRNNMASPDSTQRHDGQPLPGNSVHFVGVGTCNGVRSVAEVVMRRTGFQFAIASSGAFQSVEELLVGGLKDGTALPGDLANLDPRKLAPASVGCNGRDDSAVVLGNGTRVTGDVRSSGGIQFDPNRSEVLGQVKRHADPVAIPPMDLSDPTVDKPGTVEMNGPQSSLALTGFVRLKNGGSPVSVSGDVKLNNAVVYVDGDLEVSGGITGIGILQVNGNVTCKKGANLATTGQAALVARGDVTLLGKGQQESSFHGMVYTEGNFRADSITLVGTFIANARQGSKVSLNRVTLLHVPGYTRTNLQVTSRYQTGYGSRYGGAYGGSSGSPDYDQSGGSASIQILVGGGGVSVQVGPIKINVGGTACGPNVHDGSVSVPIGAGGVDVGPEGVAVRLGGGGGGRTGSTQDNPRGTTGDVSATTGETISSTSEEVVTTEDFTLDANRFLTPAQQVHVIFWR